MKQKNIFLGVSVALYSYLFYMQGLGVNFLLFSIIQIVFFYLAYKENTRTMLWKLSALGVLTSAIAIFIYGSTLGFVANIISLGALAFSSISPGTSMLMGLFHTIYSVFGSSIFVVFDIVEKVENPSSKDKSAKRFKNSLIYVASFGIMLLFLGLYRSSNAVFKSITDKIDLSFISGPWILFTTIGLLLLYGLYKYRTISQFEKFDLESENDLQVNPEPNFFDGMLSIASEVKAGIILFTMLNGLLLFVNLIDVVFLYGGAEMPEGMNHSGIVHQGVNSLITSIVMAVGIILFFFRGRLNFIRNNKLLLNLSYIWIIQNAFIILSTAYRNHLYISDYLLTYKRIGVYVYLALSLIGLVYTFLKIKNVKTNWYIVRYVSWSFFAILAFSPLVNWNQVIVDYNFAHGKENVRNLDLDYLVNLSPETLPQVIVQMNKIDKDLVKEYSKNIENRADWYLRKQGNYDWRSFNVVDQGAVKALNKLFPNLKVENEKNRQVASRNSRVYR